MPRIAFPLISNDCQEIIFSAYGSYDEGKI